MTRRRSALSGLWLQLTLQAAFAVTAINGAQAADTLATQSTFLTTSADDAFVYSASAAESAIPQPQSSFEDFSLAFYLPPAPHDHTEFVQLPDLDAALLGGPERNYDWHSDDFLL